MANGASGITSQRQDGLPCRHTSGATSATAARSPFQIPGVGRLFVVGSFGGGTHGEFIHVDAAPGNGSGFVELGDGGGVVGRYKIFQDAAGGTGFFAFFDNQILDRDRNAVQWPERFSGSTSFIRRFG